MVEGVKTFKAARSLLEKHGVKLRRLDFQVGVGRGLGRKGWLILKLSSSGLLRGRSQPRVSCSFSAKNEMALGDEDTFISCNYSCPRLPDHNTEKTNPSTKYHEVS